MIWKSILKNLKNLNLEVAGGDLKDPTPSVDMDLAQYDPTINECPKLCLNVSQSVRIMIPSSTYARHAFPIKNTS